MEALALLSIDLYCRTNGWYEVALQRATQALALADEARDTRIAVMARISLSETERLLGRFPHAIELAERAIVAIDAADELGPSLGHHRDAAAHSLALAYALSSHRERAIQTSVESVDRTATNGPPARRAEVLTGLAEVAEVAGDRELAVDTAKRALQAATGLVGGITWDIRAELVLARLALLDGDANLSLGHASAAAGRLAQRDLPHVALQIAVELARGRALLAAEFDADARDALASAQQRVVRIADRITDLALRTDFLSRSSIARSVFVAAAQVGLTAVEVTVVSHPPDEPDILTRRELEVLRQVAAGLPNREIADQLFISEKTVARHLTNIFTKLDVESRTQAAAWAFRQGVV
jgi:DNA-binding NarL/FixJ family response regulator